MGLKMPSEEDVLANKIFLNRASVRNKAKSWLNASSGVETEQTSSSTLPKTDQSPVEDDLSTIRGSDELSGIGVVSKSAEDDPTNRQLMSANEALRRKLLSKQAYERYSEVKKSGTDKPRAAHKRIELDEDDIEEEGKGKSIRQTVMESAAEDEDQTNDRTESTIIKTPEALIKKKKRPSSYLDQLLADRKGRQQKKAKKSDSND